MKKISKKILGLFISMIILLVITAFAINDPSADFTKQSINLNDQIFLSKISTKNSEEGFFKSSLKFQQESLKNSSKEFYGQKILIADNILMDKILIGVTNNLISRIEIWNHGNLVEAKELGFMNKMTWGETQIMTVEFSDHTNEKYNGKSKISMRFYDGSGIFGDIGTINFDLTKYGEINGERSIGVFAKSINSNNVNKPNFSDLHIWKNYNSFD